MHRRCKQFVSKFSIWAWSANAAANRRGADRYDEQFYLVSPKETFVDITRALNGFVPNSIRNSSTMHKLVYGVRLWRRPQMYGWRIVKTLTRSEVREGIGNFIRNNPTVGLQFEKDLMLEEGLE